MKTAELTESTEKKGFALGFGALVSGLTVGLTAFCCITPVALGAAGLALAGVGAKLEPYRPYFLGATFLFLAFGFYHAYRPQAEECEGDKICATPKGRRRLRLTLWIITLLAIVLSAIPYAASYYTYLTLTWE